ncbi:MAG: DUF4388 domain-containing protein [Candidatus Coatesbacteria bacterium]|nr:MAG: DUF4388 domain-containing protein [Candidatus Coatesbacteria bacterium]
MSLDGSLEDFPLTDVFQLILMGERSGMLEIERDRRRAVIYFEKGQAVHAELDNLSGEKAAYEVFDWDEGKFAFQTDVAAPDRTITLDCHNLVLEAVRRLDEWDKIRAVIPTNDYVIGFSAVHEDLASRIKLEAADWKIVSLIDGSSSPKEIAEKSGTSEFETSLIICELVRLGLLEVLPPGTTGATFEAPGEPIVPEAAGDESGLVSFARFINGLLDNFDKPDGLYNAIEQDATLAERIDSLAERYPETGLVSFDDDGRVDILDLDGKEADIDDNAKKNLIIALAEAKEQVFLAAEKQSNKAAAARRHDKVLDAVFRGRDPADLGLGNVLKRKGHE